MRIILNNLQNSRKTLAKLIRNYYNTEYDKEEFYKQSQKFKTIVYGLQTLLSYEKALQDNEILTRIERLESLIEDKSKQ